MSITVGSYTFEGPYANTENLEDRAGVYVILCGQRYVVIDVGETATVKSRVENHERSGCWTRNCKETISVAVLYTPKLQQAGRREIEQEIRNQYSPPCGTV